MSEKEKAKRILIYILMVILTVAGLALIFNEQIKTFTIDHMQENALNQPIKKHPKIGQFDDAKVGEVTTKDVAKAATTNASDSIGKIAIPAIGLKLPIFYGMATNNMLRGACTMHPNEQMGMQGNYCLAGHHMENNRILFGPLQNASKGDLIYLTDGKKIYTYQIQEKVVVSEYQVNWIANINDGNYLTLVTCASGHPGETRRIIIRGNLTGIQDVNKQNTKVFTND